jgi:hypothetical protein
MSRFLIMEIDRARALDCLRAAMLCANEGLASTARPFIGIAVTS